MRATAKVDSNWMLTGSYVDDGWWGSKELFVFQKVTDTKSGRHDYESQGLAYHISKQA